VRHLWSWFVAVVVFFFLFRNLHTQIWINTNGGTASGNWISKKDPHKLQSEFNLLNADLSIETEKVGLFADDNCCSRKPVSFNCLLFKKKEKMLGKKF
jgi:hypothetical protein